MAACFHIGSARSGRVLKRKQKEIRGREWVGLVWHLGVSPEARPRTPTHHEDISRAGGKNQDSHPEVVPTGSGMLNWW